MPFRVPWCWMVELIPYLTAESMKRQLPSQPLTLKGNQRKQIFHRRKTLPCGSVRLQREDGKGERQERISITETTPILSLLSLPRYIATALKSNSLAAAEPLSLKPRHLSVVTLTRIDAFLDYLSSFTLMWFTSRCTFVQIVQSAIKRLGILN